MKYDKKTKWEKFDIFGPIKIVLILFPFRIMYTNTLLHFTQRNFLVTPFSGRLH